MPEGHPHDGVVILLPAHDKQLEELVTQEEHYVLQEGQVETPVS